VGEYLHVAECLRQDVRTRRLYFVDIDQCRVYTYEPSTETLGYQTFAKKVTSLALTAKGDGVSPVAR
jgi:hypothetical protein